MGWGGVDGIWNLRGIMIDLRRAIALFCPVYVIGGRDLFEVSAFVVGHIRRAELYARGRNGFSWRTAGEGEGKVRGELLPGLFPWPLGWCVGLRAGD